MLIETIWPVPLCILFVNVLKHLTDLILRICRSLPNSSGAMNYYWNVGYITAYESGRLWDPAQIYTCLIGQGCFIRHGLLACKINTSYPWIKPATLDVSHILLFSITHAVFLNGLIHSYMHWILYHVSINLY